MMRLTVAAVGRLRDGPQAALVEDYAARIRALGRIVGITAFDLTEVEAPKALTGDARCAREAALLAEAARGAARRVVLDERGRDLSSAAIAATIAGWRDEGAREIAFLIGGADGHAASTREAADLVMRFGAATWPHMLARAMLSEQIYRAMTILAGHPYHRA